MRADISVPEFIYKMGKMWVWRLNACMIYTNINFIFKLYIKICYTCMLLCLWYIVVVQSLSHVRLFASLWTAACQAPLSFIISCGLLNHIHWVNDAIQSCHSLLPSSPAFNLSQHQCLFQWVGYLYKILYYTIHISLWN